VGCPSDCITYFFLNVRGHCEVADDTSAAKSSKNEDADNHVVPSGCLHPLVADPELVIFTDQAVALEDALRVCAGVVVVKPFHRVVWCGAVHVVSLTAIHVAADGGRGRHVVLMSTG
jgi:hypothetical protein